MKKLRRFRVQINAKDMAYVEGEEVRFVGGLLEVIVGGKAVAIFMPNKWFWVCEEPA